MPLFTSLLSVLSIFCVVDLAATKVQSSDHLFVHDTLSGVFVIGINVVIAVLDLVFEIVDVFDSLALVREEIEVSRIIRLVAEVELGLLACLADLVDGKHLFLLLSHEAQLHFVLLGQSAGVLADPSVNEFAGAAPRSKFLNQAYSRLCVLLGPFRFGVILKRIPALSLLLQRFGFFSITMEDELLASLSL